MRTVIALMMEAARTSETSLYSETTRCYIPEDSHLCVYLSLDHNKCVNVLKHTSSSEFTLSKLVTDDNYGIRRP
jgi:hypothetical protein